jgi:hypothetical protein
MLGAVATAQKRVFGIKNVTYVPSTLPVLAAGHPYNLRSYRLIQVAEQCAGRLVT